MSRGLVQDDRGLGEQGAGGVARLEGAAIYLLWNIF